MGKRTSRDFRSRAGKMGLGSWAVIALLGCSAEAPIDGSGEGEAGEDVGSIHDELVVGVSDPAAYLDSCWNNNVPKPPRWGNSNVGSDKNWFSRGGIQAGEDFLGLGQSDIYFANPVQKNGGRGVCVIAAHKGGSLGAFDIICQGSTGKACFWEGSQSGDINVAPADVDLLGSGWTSGGKPVIPPNPTFCTNCHAGQNVFITHANPGSALAQPTPAEVMARPGLEAWMPASYGFDPLGGASSSSVLGGSNPAKDPFTGYPASSSNCLTCHNSALGGGFPLLTTSQFKGAGGTICSVINAVTNRPASLGGMPPTWANGTVNNCTPGFDCAQQRDPFVQKMLSSCGIAYDPGGSGATPAFARDIHPATPFLFNTPSPNAGVFTVVTSQDGQGSAFLAKWVFKSSNDFWGIPGNDLPTESSGRNYFTRDRPTGYLKGNTKIAFLVTSHAAPNDQFGEIGDVYERTLDGQINNVTNGAFKPNGQPAGLYRPADNYNSVYVADASGWIHQFDWGPNSTGWTGNYNLHDYGQVNTARSSPMAFTGIGNTIVVAYQCGARSSCEMRYDFSTGWAESHVLSPIPLVAGTRPTALLFGGKQYTFFTTTSGLYAAVDSTGTGYAAPARISITTSGFFSSPMPYVRGDGKLEVLINYTDVNGGQNLVAHTLSGNLWSRATLFSYTANGVAPVVGDPVGYVRAVVSNRNGALFLDANRNVRNVEQATANGPWAFAMSANHDSKSLILPVGTWKRYTP